MKGVLTRAFEKRSARAIAAGMSCSETAAAKSTMAAWRLAKFGWPTSFCSSAMTASKLFTAGGAAFSELAPLTGRVAAPFGASATGTFLSRDFNTTVVVITATANKQPMAILDFALITKRANGPRVRVETVRAVAALTELAGAACAALAASPAASAVDD